MANPVQKNLDWLWRLFFYSPNQPPVGFQRTIAPTVDVTLDWPQVPVIKTADYSSAIGTVTTTYAVPPGRHWMIDHWSVYGSFTAADVLIVSLLSPGGTLDCRLMYRIQPGGSDTVGLVNALGAGNPASAYGPNWLPGLSKIYVPGGWSLLLQHTSLAVVAGFSNRMVVRDYLDYQPLRTI